MKRLAIYICCTLLISVIPCLVGLYWLLNTSAGARFALNTLPGIAGQAVSVRAVDGTLLGNLRLSGLRFSQPELKIEIDTLHLSWEPRQLLYGNIAVNDLILSGVHIQDDSAPSTTPPQLSWPRPSGMGRNMTARISRLRINELNYRHLKAPPIIVTELSTSLAYSSGLLTLPELRLVTPDGDASGAIAAGFTDPLLRLDLAIIPALPVGEMDHVSVQARLLAGQGKELLSGGVVVAGSSGGKKRLQLTAELGMADNSFNMRKLNLIRPGRRGTVTGEGSMTLTTLEPLFELALKTADLDLEDELERPTRLSGTVNFSGSLSSFHGNFALVNSGPGWEAAALAADYQGTDTELTLAELDGALLEGRVTGDLYVTWKKGVQISGVLAGRGLNPRRVAADWPGLVNLDLTGNLDVPNQGALSGKLHGKLLKSRLNALELQGELLADFKGEQLRVEQLLLSGDGFEIKGAGVLDQRLNLTATVKDLSRLVPDAEGEFQGDGWLRWHNRLLSGGANVNGSHLVVAGMGAETVQLKGTLGERVGKNTPVQLDASLKKLQLGGVRIETAQLSLNGTSEQHTLNAVFNSPGSEAAVTLSGGYGDGIWVGELARFSGRDRVGPWHLAAPVPLTFSADRFSLATAVINGLPSERLELAGEFDRHPPAGAFQGAWSGVNLKRAQVWLDGIELTGDSSGDLDLKYLPGGQLMLSGRAGAYGSLVSDGHRLSLEKISATFKGDGHGLNATVDLSLEGGAGEAHLLFSSPVAAAPRVPEQGDLTLRWLDLDMVLLKPWLPSDINLAGKLSGQANGKFLPDQHFELAGETTFSQGKVKLQSDAGKMDAKLKPVVLDFTWRGAALSGTLLLPLAEYGEAHGSFLLPIPARFPVVINQNGVLEGTLSGQLQERGFLSTTFPGLVQDSLGNFDLNLKLGGIWNKPRLGGYLQLAKGGAYLPTAGIRVADMQLAARLEGEQIHVDNFSALSGDGRLIGTAVVRLKGWQVAGYSGTVNGERFQTVNLPELQLSSSPQLTFEGEGGTITVRGELLIPEMNYFGRQGSKVVTVSPDVVMEGAEVTPEGRKSSLILNGQVHLMLGDKAFVKSAGIDAQLGGSLDLVLNGVDNISSNGEIKVVKGRYRAYGIDLDIVRGRLYYVNGPVSQPTLDILALRTIGDVRAGVTVAGNLNSPVIKLYSEPPLPDVDIMAYMVLGHPLGSSTEQGSMVTMAASSLFSYGDSESLQEQIKGRLGLSNIGVETVSTSGTGLMGYKELSGAPPGVTPTESAPGQSVFAVGKYLTPKIYLSYGRSLVTGENLFLLRYDVLEHWQIETQSGSESGADLYYKLEFK